MAVFPVDGSRLRLRATGVVGEAAEMVQGVDGKWSNVGQARNPDTGFPLWELEVMYRAEQYGRSSTVVALVTVPSMERPVVPDDVFLSFQGLSVSVSSPKGRPGSLVERWSAEGVEVPRVARAAKSEG